MVSHPYLHSRAYVVWIVTSEVSQTLSGSGPNPFSQRPHITYCFMYPSTGSRVPSGLGCMHAATVCQFNSSSHHPLFYESMPMEGKPWNSDWDLCSYHFYLFQSWTLSFFPCTSKGKNSPTLKDGEPQGETEDQNPTETLFPRMLEEFCACLDSSFTLLVSERHLIPTRGCTAKYVTSKR